MARRSLIMVLMVSVVLAAFIMAAVDTATAAQKGTKTKPDKKQIAQCERQRKNCEALCNKNAGAAADLCVADCRLDAYNCTAPGNLLGRTGEQTAPDTGAGTRQKGKGVQDTVGVGGDKQVGGGTKLKDRVGQHKLDLGGAQQLQQSGGTSGTSTIQRSYSGKKH